MIAATMLWMTLTGAVIAGAAWCIERALVWIGGARRQVWLAAMIGMCVLPVLPDGVLPRLRLDAATDIGTVAPSGVSAAEQLAAIAHRADENAERGPALQSVVAFLPWLNIPLATLWVIVSLTMLMSVCRGTWQLHRAKDGWTLWQRPGALRPAVWFSDDVGPAAFGASVGEIVLPAWTRRLSHVDLQLLMRHERSHVIAGDPRLIWVGAVLVMLAPWLLPLRWAYRRLQRAVEHDCDRRVLRDARLVRRYAELLLHVAERTIHPAPWHARLLTDSSSAVGLLSLTPRHTSLEARIRALRVPQVTWRTRVRAAGMASAAAVALLLALAIPMPQLDAATPGGAALRNLLGLGETSPSFRGRVRRATTPDDVRRIPSDSLYFATTDSLVISALESSAPRLLRLAATSQPYLSVALSPENEVVAHAIGAPGRITASSHPVIEAFVRARAAADARIPFSVEAHEAFQDRVQLLANDPATWLHSLGVSHLVVDEHPLTMLWIRLKRT